jgi:hypothetical protein
VMSFVFQDVNNNKWWRGQNNNDGGGLIGNV